MLLPNSAVRSNVCLSSPRAHSDSNVRDLTYDPHPTLRRRARTQTLIPPLQRRRLTLHDGGRCLITGEFAGDCIDACHILQGKSLESKVSVFLTFFPSLLVIVFPSYANTNLVGGWSVAPSMSTAPRTLFIVSYIPNTWIPAVMRRIQCDPIGIGHMMLLIGP
jgi:hypothetical protein